jgi:hypothetical protein
VSISLATLALRLARTSPAILRAAQREIDDPLPIIRTRVKASALSKLPKRGGLAAWAAAAHLTAQVHTAGQTVTAALKVHRTSLYKASDLRALDRGRVRHPAWGRRSPGAWSVQIVPAKVYSEPIADSPEWRRAAVRAAEAGAAVIRHGR